MLNAFISFNEFYEIVGLEQKYGLDAKYRG